MERLTASRNIIDIYAYCGTSVVTEFAGKELISMVNRLSSTQRLEMAIQVAQGVADVHGLTYDRPSLVHNDLNLANLVVTQDNRAVLNDFNIAILLMKHNETNETCPFVSHFPNPQWRAPEEQVTSEEESSNDPPRVTEKTDIYALGNVFYRLAVGASPWKLPRTKKISPGQKDIIARLKRDKGTLPPVPKCVEEYDDPAVQALLEAMRQAYRFQPETRPTASAIASYLVETLSEIQSMNKTDRVPLWDGIARRKLSASAVRSDGVASLVNISIGNAICAVARAGDPAGITELLQYRL
jgi:serine/threonine protein kinase